SEAVRLVMLRFRMVIERLAALHLVCVLVGCGNRDAFRHTFLHHRGRHFGTLGRGFASQFLVMFLTERLCIPRQSLIPLPMPEYLRPRHCQPECSPAPPFYRP